MLELDVPIEKGEKPYIQLYPQPIEIKWTKNHHLAADEMTASIGWMEGGVDPRYLKNARVAMWMWDEEASVLIDALHLRFTGIVKKATRRLTDNGWVVDLYCHDYTSMFIVMRPFPQSGIPEWSDTLITAWQRICDNTGYKDPATGQIVSSVKAMRDNIELVPADLASRTLGDMTFARFREISKPTPRVGSDAWAVWQWCVGMLGLVSYIDRGKCFVTTTNEFYDAEHAPMFVYGMNILGLEEDANADMMNEGVLLKSFDPLGNTPLESVYPLPDDDRIRKKRSVVKRSTKESRDPTLNEVSGQYEEFSTPWVTTQEALDNLARTVYEQRSKQEVQGSLKTAEMVVHAPFGDGTDFEVDIMELVAGDCIYLGIDQETHDAIKHTGSREERVQELMDTCNYDRFQAELIASNIGDLVLAKPIFHVETLDVHLTPDSFEVEIKFHNKIFIPDS